MKNLFRFFAIIIFIFSFNACVIEKYRDGACEVYYGYYYCKYAADESDCGSSDEHYFPSSSCKDLGYTKKDPDSNPSYGLHFFSPDGEEYWGDNGWFADNGGASGLPAYCADGYTGPSGDPQVDGFCQAAWNAICNGGYSPTSTEVQSYCDTFEAFGVSYSCSYCD